MALNPKPTPQPFDGQLGSCTQTITRVVDSTCMDVAAPLAGVPEVLPDLGLTQGPVGALPEPWCQGTAKQVDRLPTKDEIVGLLKSHPLVKLAESPSRVFVIGSFAKGTQRDHSDIDVLLEIQRKRNGDTAEDVAEHYRSKIRKFFIAHDLRGKHDSAHPQWDGRRVDIYFTYNGDEGLLPKVDITKPHKPVHIEASIGSDAWFAGSKVVDEDGNRLCVHHGTNQAFEAFAPRTSTVPLAEIGFWFVADSRVAEGIALRKGSVEEARVIPAHLALRNPLVLERPGVDGLRLLVEAIQGESGGEVARDQVWAYRKRLEALGYDGIILRNVGADGGRSDNFIAFSPDQIARLD